MCSFFCLLPNNHVLPRGTGTDPLHGHTTQLALNELDVRARIGRQILPPGHAHRVALPPRQSDVLDLYLLQDVGVSRVRVLVAGAVGQDVRDRDLDLVEVVEDVELGQVQGRVVVDGVGVAGQDEVEPAAPATAAGRDAEFLTHALQLVADLVELFGWEGSRADAGRVGFDDADDGGDAGRVDGEALDGAAQAGRGGRHVGVGAVVEVEHEGVGALDEGVRAVFVFLQEGELVDDEGSEFFAVGLFVVLPILAEMSNVYKPDWKEAFCSP